MFTGLIEEVGSVIAIRAGGRGTQLQIAAHRIGKKMRTGDSVAVNGCCLTLSSQRGDQLTFDLLEETIGRTNLKILRPDVPVNLERALSAAHPPRAYHGVDRSGPCVRVSPGRHDPAGVAHGEPLFHLPDTQVGARVVGQDVLLFRGAPAARDVAIDRGRGHGHCRGDRLLRCARLCPL